MNLALVVSIESRYVVLYANELYAAVKKKKIPDAKSFVLESMQNFYFRSPAAKMYGGKLTVSKTIPLNPAGFQHSVLEPVQVLNLKAEKITGLYEIHVKIRQVKE